MEPFFNGKYVYICENSPARKGLCLVKGEIYYVEPILIADKWYATVFSNDGYIRHELLSHFITVAEFRKEKIDEILKDL